MQGIGKDFKLIQDKKICNYGGLLETAIPVIDGNDKVTLSCKYWG